MSEIHAETAYLFRHALVREAAYELQPPGERAALHALVLEVVETLLGNADPLLDVWAAELADHANRAQAFRHTANLAALKALAAKELGYLRRAQKHAAREYQHAQVIEFGRRIGAHPGADPAQRHDALVSAGDAQSELGRMLDARELFGQALSCAADGSGRGRALRAIGITYARAEGMPAAEPFFRRALEEFQESGDRVGTGMAAMTLALSRVQAVPQEESLESYRQALAILEQAGNGHGQAATLSNMGNLLRMMGRGAEAEQCLRRALELHRKSGERHVESTVLSNLAALLAELERAQEADALNHEALRLARETGSRAREGTATLHLAIAAYNAGRLDDAVALFHASFAASMEGGDLFWQGVALMNLAFVHEEREELDDAEVNGTRAREILQRLNARGELALTTACLAEVAAKRGELGRARELFEHALPMLAGAHPAMQGVHRGGYAVLLKRLGEAGAEREYEHARGLLKQHDAQTDLARLESRWARA